VNRGEIWLAQVGRRRRPVLILTRSEVLDVRALVTVAEITTSLRGLAAEVPLDQAQLGLDREWAVNCDGVHAVSQTMLAEFVAVVDRSTMSRVCAAVSYALGC
jgi:mRNA interferase MazF